MAPRIPASDIPRRHWIDALLPAPWRPYIRLARIDRPIGIWLLMLPCWWGVALATPSFPDFVMLALFALGALVMRGAGCTFNDIVDRDFDRRVARTTDRPIPSGQISVRQAVIFALFLLLLSFIILIQFNNFTKLVGLCSLFLVFSYPFAKRYTYWPQAVLGLTFNWGVLVGWSAVHGDLAPPPLVLYGAAFLWTIAYDTVYAHQDKDDDLSIGVKSTALLFGAATRRWLMFFFAGTLLLVALSGWMIGLAWPFYVVLAVTAVHFGWQTASVDLDDPQNCLRIFRSNRTAGLLIFASIVLGQMAVP
jgi:4-hydroxybenzoate polyprenyltransferase